MRFIPIRFSLRTLLAGATLAVGASAVYWYLNPPTTIGERIDNSFGGHAIYAHPEVGRFGFHSDVLLAIANSTPDSLRRAEIVAAWSRSDENELVVLFLASSLTVDALQIRDKNGVDAEIRIPRDQLVKNRCKGAHSIDFQLAVPVQHDILPTIRSVALVNDQTVVTKYFAVRHSPVDETAEPCDATERRW